MFDQKKAENHLKSLLRRYKIKVKQWSVGSNGRAWPDAQLVKIPKPTDVDRFCVGMHEIKHIIDGIEKKLYQREYACEMFAIEQAESLGFDCADYKERARRYIIMNIAKGHCRRLDLSKIEPEIREFCQVDFGKWVGRKVFVSGWGNAKREFKISIE